MFGTVAAFLVCQVKFLHSSSPNPENQGSPRTICIYKCGYSVNDMLLSVYYLKEGFIFSKGFQKSANGFEQFSPKMSKER